MNVRGRISGLGAWWSIQPGCPYYTLVVHTTLRIGRPYYTLVVHTTLRIGSPYYTLVVHTTLRIGCLYYTLVVHTTLHIGCPYYTLVVHTNFKVYYHHWSTLPYPTLLTYIGCPCPSLLAGWYVKAKCHRERGVADLYGYSYIRLQDCVHLVYGPPNLYNTYGEGSSMSVYVHPIN